MKGARFGVCLPCVVLVSLASAAADTTLRWKLKTGQRLDYVLTQKSVEKSVPLAKLDSITMQTTDLSWAVNSVDQDGTADLVQAIRRIRYQIKGNVPGADLEVDTANAAEEAGGNTSVKRLFRSMVGSQFTMKLTARGEFRDVKVPAKLLAAVKKKGSGTEWFVDEDSLKNMCAPAVVIFPEAPIAQGASWTAIRRRPYPLGTLIMDTTFTLEDAAGSVENIGLHEKLKVGPKLEPKKGPPFELKMTAQHAKGHYHFDNSAGVLKAFDAVQNMSILVTSPGYNSQTEIELTVKMELKDDDETKPGKVK